LFPIGNVCTTAGSLAPPRSSPPSTLPVEPISPQHTHSSANVGRKMSTGVTVAAGAKSCSAAAAYTRLFPPQAKGPILTIASASIETCDTSTAVSVTWFTWFTCSKIVSVWGIFLGLTFSDFLGTVAQIVKLRGDRLYRGALVIFIALEAGTIEC